MRGSSGIRTIALAVASSASLFFAAAPRAEDKLLREIVEFNGAILFMQSRVPAMIVAVVRNGETTVAGFGETSDGSGKAPDGQTILRIGSVTKAFTGQVLADLVARGTVKFTDRLQ